MMAYGEASQQVNNSDRTPLSTEFIDFAVFVCLGRLEDNSRDNDIRWTDFVASRRRESVSMNFFPISRTGRPPVNK